MWIGSDFFLEGRKFCTLLFSLFKQLGILPFPLMRLELSQELKAPQVSLKQASNGGAAPGTGSPAHQSGAGGTRAGLCIQTPAGPTPSWASTADPGGCTFRWTQEFGNEIAEISLFQQPCENASVAICRLDFTGLKCPNLLNFQHR